MNKKRVTKNWIISNIKSFIVGGLIALTISVSATAILTGSQVEYKNGESVEQKLNELYDIAYDDNGIPIKYTKLVYLESTGTQYINTGISVNINNSHLITQFEYISKTGDFGGVLMGSETDDGPWSINYNGGWFLIGGTNGVLTFDAQINTLYTYDIQLNDGNGTIQINDSVNSIQYDLVDIDYSLYLFADNIENTRVNQYSSVKLYSFKYYSSNNLIRDYVPVLDTNKRPCLFDKVSKTCFYNQGEDEFLYG